MNDSPNEIARLVEELRALDDATMCFDGEATYALINRAAATLERMAAALEAVEVREIYDHVWLVINGAETVGLPRGEDADRLRAWGRKTALAQTQAGEK